MSKAVHHGHHYQKRLSRKKAKRNFNNSIVIGRVHRKSSSLPFKQITLGLLTALILAIVLVHISTIIAITSLVLPIKNSPPFATDQTNIVIDTGSTLSLVSIDRNNQAINAYILPENGYVYVGVLDGMYKASVIYDVAETKHKGSGGAALTKAAQQLFGAPIDGYVKFNRAYDVPPEKVNDVIKRYKSYGFLFHMLTAGSLSSDIKSNLNTADQIKLWWTIRKTRFDKVTVTDLRTHNIFAQQILPDGSAVLGITTAQLDTAILDQVQDPEIAKAEIKAEVINASSVSGLGQEVARYLTHLGVTVIRIDSALVDQKTSSVTFVSDKQSKALVSRLLNLTKFTIIDDRKSTNSLADIKIVIGLDQQLRWSVKIQNQNSCCAIACENEISLR